METKLTCSKCKKERTIFRRKTTNPETKFYCEDCNKMVTPFLSKEN